MSKNKQKAISHLHSKKKHLECSAGEYFWLCNELTKARRALQASLFTSGGSEMTQAYATLTKFYQDAVQAFHVRPGTEVKQPITISKQFLSNLKILDKDGLIDLELVRKGEPNNRPA